MAVLRTLRTSLSVIFLPSTVARKTLNAFSTALALATICLSNSGSTCFSRYIR